MRHFRPSSKCSAVINDFLAHRLKSTIGPVIMYVIITISYLIQLDTMGINFGHPLFHAQWLQRAWDLSLSFSHSNRTVILNSWALCSSFISNCHQNRRHTQKTSNNNNTISKTIELIMTKKAAAHTRCVCASRELVAGQQSLVSLLAYIWW